MVAVEKYYFEAKNPGALAGREKLIKSISGNKKKSVKKSSVEKFLPTQTAYTLHVPVRRRFKRNRVIVASVNQMWDVDLLFMLNEKGDNDGYAYILMCVDVLSKFCWAGKLKSKKTDEVCHIFRGILTEAAQTKKSPLFVRSDLGGEFTSAPFAKLLAEFGIKHIKTLNSQIKANIVERLNRTIKLRLSRYFTKKKSRRWIDILPDVVHSYNNTYHRSIGMTPSEVTPGEKEEIAWRRLYQSKEADKADGEFRFKVGHTVRLSYLTKPFEHEYNQRWTSEVFKITSHRKRAGLNIYTLQDLTSEDIKGTFYEKELQGVTLDPDGVFNIDKVLRTRKRRGVKEYLVRWEGYAPAFDSWVKEDDFETV